MKKYLILAVLVMVVMGLLILKTYEIRSRYTSPIDEGYNISANETITAIIPAETLKPDISLGELANCGIPDDELIEMGFIAKAPKLPDKELLIDSDVDNDNLLKILDDMKVQSFTFYSKGEEIKIDLEDFNSMTAQEVRDFIRLVSTILILYEKDIDLDPELIGIWGMKLLPRFFNPPTLSEGERR